MRTGSMQLCEWLYSYSVHTLQQSSFLILKRQSTFCMFTKWPQSHVVRSTIIHAFFTSFAESQIVGNCILLSPVLKLPANDGLNAKVHWVTSTGYWILQLQKYPIWLLLAFANPNFTPFHSSIRYFRVTHRHVNWMEKSQGQI